MLIRVLIPTLLLLWLVSCSGKSDSLVADLDRFLMSCDSTEYTLTKEISEEDLSAALSQSTRLKEESELRWKQSDTLDLETAIKLDAFQAAYSNASGLEKEYNNCRLQSKVLRQRLVLLKEDIENGRGDRSEYSREVAREKKELTKIRRHCNDIRLRFEELKNALAELTSLLDTATLQP